jgi:hypothetical protein
MLDNELESIIYRSRKELHDQIIQNIFLTLYELRKELYRLEFIALRDYNIPQSEMASIVNSCDFILKKFPYFNIPEEAKEFYKKD